MCIRDRDESEEDEVGINNTVDVYFEDDDEVETYRLVTSVRGNSLQEMCIRDRCTDIPNRQ